MGGPRPHILFKAGNYCPIGSENTKQRSWNDKLEVGGDRTPCVDELVTLHSGDKYSKLITVQKEKPRTW